MPWQKQANKRFIKGCQSDNTSRAYDPNVQWLQRCQRLEHMQTKAFGRNRYCCLVEKAEILDLKVVWGSCLTQFFGNIIESLLLGICRNGAYLGKARQSWNQYQPPWLPDTIQIEQASPWSSWINRKCILKNESTLYLLCAHGGLIVPFPVKNRKYILKKQWVLNFTAFVPRFFYCIWSQWKVLDHTLRIKIL